MAEKKFGPIAPEDLPFVQEVERDLLRQLDRICTKYNIHYVIATGTLLGAVRYKGFIPWDDDIDVLMLRSEYEKFARACKKELEGTSYFLQDVDTDPNYIWGYAKLRNLDTEFIRVHQEHFKMKTGFSVDVFIVDNLPNNPLLKRIHNGITFAIRKVSYARIGSLYEEKAALRFIYQLLCLIPTSFSMGCYRLLYRWCNCFPAEKVSCYGWHGRWSIQGYRREWMTRVTRLEFDGDYYMAPKEWDEVLTHIYGPDYMTPLPESERGSTNPCSIYSL